MTKICIDCRYLGPRPSGIAELVQALVNYLPELAPDLQFHLLRHPAKAEPLSRAANVTEAAVPYASNGPATMWAMPQIADLRGVDLFHAPANIMPGRLTIPCLTTVHDIMWLTDPKLCETGAKAEIKRRFFAHGIDRALRDAAAIAAVSDATRSAILKYRPDAKLKTFTTISGVADDFRPTPASPHLLARVGLKVGQRYVLTVGQYSPYKNHEGALAAMALAFAGRDDLALVLVQRQGRSTAYLQRLARKLGIASQVIMPRLLARADLVQLYSSAAALLHPSWCEGFGNPLAEAMACGCPVVTSDQSAMPEVTGGAALLAHPHSTTALAAALRRVIDEPALAANLRTKGLARASQLNWQTFAEANLAIYRKLL